MRTERLLKLIILCTAACSLFSGCSGKASSQDLSKGQLNKGVRIVFAKTEESEHQRIPEIEEEIINSLNSIGKFLGTLPKLELRIVLLKNKPFLKLLQNRDWINTFYYQERIYINIESNSYKHRHVFKNSLKHELVHAVLDALPNNEIPVWLDEGLASYLSEGIRKSEKKAYQAMARNNNLLPFSKLSKGFALLKVEESYPAYLQSKYMFKYLLEVSNRKSLLEFLSDPRSDFKLHFNISKTDFFRNFLNWSKYNKGYGI